MANGKRSHRRDGEVTVPWAQHLQLHFLILLQAAQENDLRASRATVPMLRGTTPCSARPVPLPLSVPEHTLAPCSGTGSQTCSLQGKQPGSNPAPAQSQRPPQVPAVPSPTAWGPEAQRGARHTAALLGGRPHLVPLDYARPRGKREVPKSTEGFVCSFGMQQQGQGAGQVFQPATYWDDLQTGCHLQHQHPSGQSPSPRHAQPSPASPAAWLDFLPMFSTARINYLLWCCQPAPETPFKERSGESEAGQPSPEVLLR